MTHPLYVSPIDQSPLKQIDDYLQDQTGNQFPIQNGIPNFIYPKELPDSDLKSIEWYKQNASSYDTYLPLTFKTFNVDEDQERDYIISLLDLKADHRVLEIGCGTGRDSEKIAQQLGPEGTLYLQDISQEILDITVSKFSQKSYSPKINFSYANGYYLPFPDQYFDRSFHLGGLNTFGDIKRALAELTRVTKTGGKIVIGDENMPIWLRETEFGRVLMNSNPHFQHHVPLEALPIEARNVKVEWVTGGVFYVISFDVGSGEPYADLDFELPGIRGGTHRSRYYGHLEGLSESAKKMAQLAREKSNKSMYQWLNDAIEKAAKDDLKD